MRIVNSLLSSLLVALATSSFCVGQTKASLFLPDDAKEHLLEVSTVSREAELLKAIQIRAERRAYTPNITEPGGTTEWWHHSFEYVSDASLTYALHPTERLGAWLRGTVLDIVRRPVADWAGPRFRGYGGGDMVGGLETAHLTWAVSFAYDTVPSLFSESEKAEIEDCLRHKGMVPCLRYLKQSDTFHNWNCVLFAGLSISAAVLCDSDCLNYAKEYFPVVLDHFQPDGSYGESLQYANYAAYAIMVGQEALLRSGTLGEADLDPYAGIVDWAWYAHLYRKPLSGWPVSNLPRSANFGDCASVFRPSGDLLMHIALRAKDQFPRQAGLARWLFDHHYTPANENVPHDLASFGMVNDFGALSVILSDKAAQPSRPSEEDHPLAKVFSGGDSFLRDSWGGKTVVAFRAPSEPRHAFAHLHEDVNSLILAFNQERLLVDPGHTCYRNITRSIDVGAESHNTCTFEVLDEDGNVDILRQKKGENRRMSETDGRKVGGELASMGGKRLLCDSRSGLSVVASDASDLYGFPLTEFKRFVVLCGGNVVFVIDKVRSELPTRATWNWLLNNRDGLLTYDSYWPREVKAVRNDAGIRLSNHSTERNLEGPVYAMMHDCYQILPGRSTEGQPGSAIMYRFKERGFSKERTTVHTMALDTPAALEDWSSRMEGDECLVVSKSRGQEWSLRVEGKRVLIKAAHERRSYSISCGKDGGWTLCDN